MPRDTNIRSTRIAYTPDAVILAFDDRDAKIARAWSAKSGAAPAPCAVLTHPQFLDAGRVADHLDAGEAKNEADSLAAKRV